MEQILEPPLQHFRSKKLFSIPEEEEEEEEDGEEDGEAAQEEKGPGAGSASRDPGPPAPLPPGLGCDGARPRGPGLCASSCSPCRVGDRPEDPLGLVGGGSWRKGSGSPEKPPGRRRSPDHREHCSRLLSNGGGGSQAPGRATGPARERGGPSAPEGARAAPDAGGRARPAPSRKCPRGRAPEPGLASCLSPKCLEISIEYDSEDEQEMGGGDMSITSSGCLGDGEAWGAAPVGRPRAPPKAGSGPHPYPCSAAWEKGEPERRGRSATGRAKEPPPRVRALSRPGSPLPAAARWPCLLPTGRSHSTLPPPSAEVGWGLGAPSPASSHPHSTALLLLPSIGTGMR